MVKIGQRPGAPPPDRQQYTLSGSDPDFEGLRGSITITDNGIEYVRSMGDEITQAVRVRERRCDLELRDISPEEAMIAVNAIKAARYGSGSPPTWTATNPEPPLKEPASRGGRFSGLDLDNG